MAILMPVQTTTMAASPRQRVLPAARMVGPFAVMMSSITWSRNPLKSCRSSGGMLVGTVGSICCCARAGAAQTRSAARARPAARMRGRAAPSRRDAGRRPCRAFTTRAASSASAARVARRGRRCSVRRGGAVVMASGSRASSRETTGRGRRRGVPRCRPSGGHARRARREGSPGAPPRVRAVVARRRAAGPWPRSPRGLAVAARRRTPRRS